MGAALYIVAKNKPEELDAFVNGKALSRAEARLAAAADKLGVSPLMSFFSQNPSELADLLGDGVELDSLPPERWFSATEGLVTVRALIGEFSHSESDHTILDDLREFEDVLSRLEASGIPWHLSVDF